MDFSFPSVATSPSSGGVFSSPSLSSPSRSSPPLSSSFLQQRRRRREKSPENSKISVGSSFQAEIPSLLSPEERQRQEEESKLRGEQDVGRVIWDPLFNLPEIHSFLEQAKLIYQRKELEKDFSEEEALRIFCEEKDCKRALRRIVQTPRECLTPSWLAEKWDQSENELFELGVATHGNDLLQIQSLVQTKCLGAILYRYFKMKHTPLRMGNKTRRTTSRELNKIVAIEGESKTLYRRISTLSQQYSVSIPVPTHEDHEDDSESAVAAVDYHIFKKREKEKRSSQQEMWMRKEEREREIGEKIEGLKRKRRKKIELKEKGGEENKKEEQEKTNEKKEEEGEEEEEKKQKKEVEEEKETERKRCTTPPLGFSFRFPRPPEESLVVGDKTNAIEKEKKEREKEGEKEKRQEKEKEKEKGKEEELGAEEEEEKEEEEEEWTEWTDEEEWESFQNPKIQRTPTKNNKSSSSSSSSLQQQQQNSKMEKVGPSPVRMYGMKKRKRVKRYFVDEMFDYYEL